MTALVGYMLLGSMSPFAAFGVCALIHFARCRRPATWPVGMEPRPQAYFIEVAADARPSATPSPR